jgi:hypothetical protein
MHTFSAIHHALSRLLYIVHFLDFLDMNIFLNFKYKKKFDLTMGLITLHLPMPSDGKVVISPLTDNT